MDQAQGATRLTSFVDWTRASDPFEQARFEALQRLMLVAMVAHCGMLLLRPDLLGNAARWGLEPAFVLSALIGLSSNTARPYCVMMSLATTSVWLTLAAPTFANHLVLEWWVLLFLTVGRNDAALAMKACRWLMVTVLFYSGLQKLVVGDYLGGQFLAVSAASVPNFTDFMSLVFPDAEVARLVAMGGRAGTGPYSSTEPLVLLISNSVWIAEMSLPVLLVVKKTRRFALYAALALIVGIELGAREVIFGFLFTSVLLVFYPARNALAIWPVLACLQLAAMVAGHVFPGLRFN